MNIQPEDQVYLFTWNPNDRKISPHDHNMKWEIMVLKYLKYLEEHAGYFV